LSNAQRARQTQLRYPVTMMRKLAGVVLVACLGSASHNSLQRLEFGALEPLATPAPPGSAEPNLSLGPGGQVFLSWIELAADSGHQLKFAALRGDRFGPARVIATGAKGDWFVNWADFPSLIALSNNQLVAHWLERSGMGRYAYGVRVARSSDGGITWSRPAIPHRDASDSEHGFVSLFRVGNEVGIAWLDGRKHAAAKSEAEAEMSVRFTRLSNSGQLSADQEIDARACDCCQTSAAITSRGPVLVYRDRSPQEVRDIALVRYEKGSWSRPRTVHHDNWVIAACPVNGPSVSAQGNRVAVAWFTGADEQPRAFVAFSKNAGEDFATPVRVDDGAAAGRVDIQLLPDNSALVSWLERANDRAEIRIRRVYANGRRSDAKTVATSSAERASGFPHIIWRGKDVVLAWTEPGRPAQVKAALLEMK
jgi:hypothetical protein